MFAETSTIVIRHRPLWLLPPYLHLQCLPLHLSFTASMRRLPTLVEDRGNLHISLWTLLVLSKKLDSFLEALYNTLNISRNASS